MKIFIRILPALSIAAALVLPTTSAFANTAANTQIINAAVLSYNDGTGVKTSTSQVTVKVSLKAVAPDIQAQAAQIGPQGVALSDSYLLTNTSNGPDNFTLTASTNTIVNATTVSATPAPSSIWLGATITLVGSTTGGGRTSLVVPSDGVSDGEVNRIAVNDTVVINGLESTVRAITDSATGTSIIEVDAVPPALQLTGIVGYVIGERTTVHAAVTPNPGTNPANITVNVTMTATSTDAAFTSTSGNVGNTFYPVSATLTKYVRNLSNDVPCALCVKTLFNGITYYHDSNVVAKPGEIMEYMLMASNGSATPVTAVVVTDLVPVDFVTLNTAVPAYSGLAFRYYPDAGVLATHTDFTAGQGDDGVDYNSADTVAINANKGKITAWIGGGVPAFGTPGTIPGNKTIILLYQTTVK